jgi:hypothetical protein
MSLSAYMPPLYLSFVSDLVYRENAVRTAHVLNSVAVHFKSAEQIVIMTMYIYFHTLINVLIEMTDCL